MILKIDDLLARSRSAFGRLFISALLPCHFKIVLKEFVNYFVMLQVDILEFEKRNIFYSAKFI